MAHHSFMNMYFHSNNVITKHSNKSIVRDIVCLRKGLFVLNVHFYLTFKLNLNVSLLKGWKEINRRALGRTRLPLDKEL